MCEIAAIIAVGQNSEGGIPVRLRNVSPSFLQRSKLSAASCNGFCACGSDVVESSEEVGSDTGPFRMLSAYWWHHDRWCGIGSRQYVQALYVSI